MGNDIKNELEEIKTNISCVIDENQQMKKKVDAMDNTIGIMKDNIEQMKRQIQNISKENWFIKEKIGDLKEVLGEIQCRDLSRNFLENFHSYLTNSDKRDIKQGKITRGKAISNRIREKFSGVNQKKLSVVQHLLETSSDLIEEGNYFAHELFMENFDKIMEDYKAKNNLDEIESPEIFCFLTNFGLTGDLFDDSFSFLKKYFKKDLRLKENVNIFEEYFN